MRGGTQSRFFRAAAPIGCADWLVVLVFLAALEYADSVKQIGASDGRRTGLWIEGYRELLSFRMQHGHCDVPRSCDSVFADRPSKNGQRLGLWVMSQRGSRRAGRLGCENRPKPVSVARVVL